jgi:hypothetical protein
MGYARPHWLLHPEAIQGRIDQDALPVLPGAVGEFLVQSATIGLVFPNILSMPLYHHWGGRCKVDA